MHYQTVVIAFILGSFVTAAPDRERRQVTNNGVLACQEIFNVSCASLGTASEPPPLKTELIGDGVSDCECVPYYQCTIDGTPNTDGTTLIDRRMGGPNRICPGSLDVCCKTASVAPDTSDDRNTGTGGTTGGTGGTGTTGGITPTPRPVPTIAPVPAKKGCGYRNTGGVGVRITGAQENQAQFAEFPWMVAVLERPVPPATQSSYACGGSLIHPRVILTAAHALEKRTVANLVVRAGEWDTQTRNEPITHQEREAEAVLYHESFNTNNLHNDFAIIILKTPFDLAPNVNTICLPQASDSFDAQRCTATGWGKDNFEKSGTYQAVLKKITLPVVPHNPCQTALRLTRLGKAFILDRSFVCAGGEPGLDTCTGDGGSPLACPLPNGDDRYVQAGIVAWGIGCGADRTPGVYGSVMKARQWIDSKMAQYNLDISSYTV